MRLKTIVYSDLKIIFRDASLTLIVLLPLLFFALLKIGSLYYEQFLPVLINYRPHILASFCILTSGIMGFILSFILLDEREQNLTAVFYVLPYSWIKLLYIRILLVMVFAFASNILIVYGSGIEEYSIVQILVLSLSTSMVGPSLTFIITCIATNKVEGVTYFKLFNMLLFLPLLGFFVESKYMLFFGILPNFWIYCGYIGTNLLSDYIILLLGFLANTILLLLSIRLYIRRMMS